ncbi:MAG TPA: carboxypeptidase-like regulatory domain-containing protein [Bryobacteraceae bacterium]|jgi:hypothetical protein
MKHVSFIAALLLLFTFHLPGQTPTGAVQGVVTDPSGAIVAGAKVSVVNVGTNETKDLTTDSSGHYLVTFLTPGSYDVSVSALGFNGAKETGIKIDVSQNRQVDFILKVGAVSEQIEVQASAAALETQSATTGQVIDSKKVVDLPLNGRNPFSLATLVPGVSNVGNASTPHIGGSRNAVNEESLDGMTNILPENNVGNNVAAYTPIVDSVQEFSVQTNSLAAEYGRFGGGVINLVTKSGTNTWHGGLFEFQRNSVLNATDFFVNRNGKTKPSSNERQYGGTLGGPIFIPKIYDGHNKTFFFFGFQGDNASAAATTTDTVPTAQQLAGNFNGIANIYDPTSTLTTNAQGQSVRAQFAGNQIPTSRLNPVALKAQSYFPAPNAGAAGAITNNFIAVGATANTDYKWDARLDHNFTPNWHMFTRVSHDWNNSSPLYDYGPTNPASQGGSGPNAGGAYSVSMDHTLTLSPTLVADFRYGFARSYSLRTPLGDGFLPSSLGLPTSLDAVGATRVLNFPRFALNNGAGLGNTGYVDLVENPSAHDITASLTKILSHHTIKFGGEWRKLFINFYQYGFPDGQFNFDQTWTQQILSNGNGTGNAYASYLLGLPTSGQVTHEPTASDASVYGALYVQDDWKVTSKLTVNIGLRWDVDLPRTERYNRLSYWDPSLPSPIQGQVPASACPSCGNLVGQLIYVGTPQSKYGRAQGPTQWKDFGPRFGFAYSGDSKTVLRGGFGISYAPSALQAAGTTGSPGVQGFGGTTNVNSSFDNQKTINATLSNPFPQGYTLPQGAAGGPGSQIGLGIGESFFSSYRNPYSIEWNFNVQRQLPGGMTLEAGYIANRGVYLVDGEVTQPYSQLNPSYAALGNQLTTQVKNPFYGIITTPGSPLSQPTVSYNQLLEPYPQYTNVGSFRKPGATSFYNGIIARLDKRFSNGLTFLASFTGGKTMDDSAAAVSYLGAISGTRADQYNRRLEWSVSPQDVSKSFVTSFVYELPFGQGKRFGNSAPRFANLLIKGWSVNGIVSAHTGTPLILSGATNQTQLNASTQRPDTTGQSAAISNPTINRWFNTSTFFQPPQFTFGNASRTIPNVRNPGAVNADISFFKNNYFGKENRENIQFRAELFNSLNHPQFSAPNTSITGGSAFGTITSLATPSRIIQLAVKFNF